MKLNLKMPDCLKQLPAKDKLRCAIEGLGVVCLFAYFFYKSVIGLLLLLPAILPYAKHRAEEINEKNKWEMLLQFRELVASVNGSMQAGYSMENAFREAGRDMVELYGKEAAIIREINNINRGVQNNIPITELLRNFAKRSQIDEIDNFTEIIAVGKSSGGKLPEIMNSYIKMIDEKVEVLQEIETMVSARKYEQRIMNIIPFVIIFYMELTSKGFFEILYHNLFGNIVMTITMIIYVAAIVMAEKIVKISI